VPTVWGTFTARWDGEELTQLLFPHQGAAGPAPTQPADARSALLAAELGEYFLGNREGFTVQGGLRGTPFQLQVWDELLRTPFAHTITYGELACRVGRPKAARAVGGAVGANPIAIVIPCHRVVGAGGRLGGFGGGTAWKRYLLRLEGDSPPGQGKGDSPHWGTAPVHPGGH